MSAGSLQAEGHLCFVRWADRSVSVAKPRSDEVEETPEERAMYDWLPFGEALLAMTTGDALAVYIPAPPDENGQERVWAWVTSGLDKEEGESIWYCTGPFNAKEALDLATSWSREKDSLSIKIKVKGLENASLAGLLGNAFEVSGKDAEPFMEVFLHGLLQYFAFVELFTELGGKSSPQ